MVAKFQDLANLSVGLATAVNSHLMSVEEARIILKRHLVDKGLKILPTRKSSPVKAKEEKDK